MSTRYTVAILLFEEVEVLDFAGPFEVFGSATGGAFDVYTVAHSTGLRRARGGLQVHVDRTMQEIGSPDILVIPGGRGIRAVVDDEAMCQAVAAAAEAAEIVLSVCTGALMLAALGLLDGMTVTTHHSALDELQQAAPTARVVSDQRFVDNGRIVTAAGVSAGIDASLHVVARLAGKQVAHAAATYIEYP